MAKNKKSRPAPRAASLPPGVVRRPGKNATGYVAAPPEAPEETKPTADIRMLGWFGDNPWLLAVLNLAATVAMAVLAVIAFSDPKNGIFLPLGFGVLALHFFVAFLIVALHLDLGPTGKWLKVLVPLVALVCLIVGLTINI